MIVFGSDYRTRARAGRARHQRATSARGRIGRDRGRGCRIASAGDAAIESIAVASVDGDAVAQQTADALARKLGAKVVALGAAGIDLIVVGSQPNDSSRRITLSGSTRTMLNAARGSVLVLPSGVPIGF